MPFLVVSKLKLSFTYILSYLIFLSEMKEYVKIVQIKKLKMKLTFSLDVQNLGGREMFFSLPYQLKLKNFTNLSDKNKLFRLLNCENQEILNSVYVTNHCKKDYF
jgi:hypothetical protein